MRLVRRANCVLTPLLAALVFFDVWFSWAFQAPAVGLRGWLRSAFGGSHAAEVA